MKDFIKFFSIITGLFRSIISILLLFAVGFIVFVDNNLFLAFFDILGYKAFSPATLKPISLVVTSLAFIINSIVARNIFKAGDNGKSHLTNIFFALVFLAIDGFLYLHYREKLIFILAAINGLLFLNSLIGLIAKLKGVYKSDEEKPVKKTEYIEVSTKSSNKNINNSNIKIDIPEKDEVKLIESEETSKDGVITSKASRLIDKNTDDNQVIGENTDTKEKDETSIKEFDQENLDKNSTHQVETSSKDEDEIHQKVDLKNEDKEAIKVLDDGLVIKEKKLEDLKKSNDGDKPIKKVNETISNDEADQTYDPELAEDFAKREEEKIYDKSRFVRNKNKEY